MLSMFQQYAKPAIPVALAVGRVRFCVRCQLVMERAGHKVTLPCVTLTFQARRCCNHPQMTSYWKNCTADMQLGTVSRLEAVANP